MSKFQGRGDGLDILRNFISQKKKIKLKDDYLCFDNVRLKLRTETPWLSTQTKTQYDLGDLWLLLDLKQKDLLQSQYIEKCSQLGLKIISKPDRDQIVSYFTGQVDSTPAINNELRIEINQRISKKEQEKQAQQESKRPKNQDAEEEKNHKILEWIIKFQRPVSNYKRMMETPSKSYREILKGMKLNMPRGDTQTSRKTKLMQIYEKKGQPIIIVPDTSQPGNVCIKNIRRLLENGEYVQANQCPDLPMRKIELTHKMRDKNIIFEITNNPTLLTHSQWQCVIAIFALGRTVQFTGWPESNLTKLFAKYKGFFVKYDKTKANELKDWNVKVITIQQMTRYEDPDVARNIWEEFQKILFAPVQ